MSRWRILMLLLLAAGVAGIWVLQRKQASTEVTPRPLLYLVADTQRELERIPLELTRVSSDVSETNRTRHTTPAAIISPRFASNRTHGDLLVSMTPKMMRISVPPA